MLPRLWQLPAQVGNPQRYGIRFAGWVAEGDFIASAVWDGPAGVLIESPIIDGMTVSAVMNCQQIGCPHQISVTVTTGSGQRRRFDYGLVATA